MIAEMAPPKKASRVTKAFIDALNQFSPPLPLLVAYSGGADSTALLAACAQRWPGQVVAVHVHHGLQPAADDFVAHCQGVCVVLGVPLTLRYVNAHAKPGQSPEDAARRVRYGALDDFLASPEGRGIGSVALAHHADDQVETMLLALSRGTGVAGMAGMPRRWLRGGLPWYRPLLSVPGEDLRSWLSEHALTWIEDPSNSDPRYTRNRIRSQLLPALQSVFPAFRETFVRSSGHAVEADMLLRELAADDLARVGTPPSIQGLQQLSHQRQSNVLRYWLVAFHQTTPAAAQLAELQRQIATCTTRGHKISIKVGRGFVERKGLLLIWREA